ncbi:tubby-related protein 4 isoform X2 [Cimex lectularius]|uniref:SOCS box domain-containing protein n=1 Tax=Cimex lectularius TaxID=79782 RepID=A0A8I6RQ62_CIMLE|nr:tubby-related protein 4 isoform X2 [Cimex lectularius]
MHLHFEKNTNTKCDCTILSLSWMGKVPDELPEDEGWKLNRTNYYQEGWLATGNVRGIVGVTYTTSHCNKTLDCPTRTNYNLRGHRSEVILVKWNEPYQKLASCDSSGVIFVWIKYEGRWSIELINDRNTRVTHFSWSHDGRMALICYQDGFVLVGSVAGQRYWSSMLNLDCTINCGIWTPDDQLVYFGTSNGQLVVMDVHGAMMAQVEIANQVAVTSMAWSCEKFKMEETDDSNDSCLCAKYVLAVSLENGVVLLMKHYYDVSPIHIQTGLCPLCIEWSNSKQLLAVAGTVPNTEYKNMVKVYTDNGNLLYSSIIPYTLSAVTAMTWGHNDKRLFVATGCIVHMAWVSMRIASLQLLCSLQVYNRLQGGAHQISSLPLPLRIQHRLSKLFAHTIRCCVPEGSGLREFVSRTPKVRLHCTMLRHDEDISANCYTLFLEYLGGLVPLLKGKRTSKLKPEFVIFDPQIADCSCKLNATLNGNYSGSEREDSECEDSCGSPRLTRRKNRNYNQNLYAGSLPEESHLAEVTSNIWGTKFRIHGIASGLASNLGQVTYKTSLLHLQPRQMTLLMAGDGPCDAGVSQVVSDDDDENGKGMDEGGAVAVAPLRARCRGAAGYHANGNNENGKTRADWFMTRSSFRDCECGESGEDNTSRRGGVVRSCSVGYLDFVEGGSNNRLVLVRQNRPARLTHAGKSRSLDSSDMDKGIAGTGHTIQPPPSSSPASPALSKKKRNTTSSPIRARIMNSPLLPRRLRSGNKRNDVDGYQDLESFQKAQLRNKIETTAKRREFIMHNKAPMWNENNQVYQLDFGGRVTQESAKNFQVEFRGKQVMQFGRIDGNAYTLDFQYPFSAVQAFAVALANVTQRLK